MQARKTAGFFSSTYALWTNLRRRFRSASRGRGLSVWRYRYVSTFTLPADDTEAAHNTWQKKPKSAEPLRSRPSAADRSITSEHEVPNDTKPAPPKLVTSSTTPQLKKTASTSSLTPVKTRPKVSTSPRLHTTPGATRTSQMRAAAAAQSDSQVAPVRHERAVSSTTSGSSSRATATTSSRPPTASSRTTVSTSPRSRKVSETGRPSFSPPKSPMSRSTSGEDKPHPPGTSQPQIVYLRK